MWGVLKRTSHILIKHCLTLESLLYIENLLKVPRQQFSSHDMRCGRLRIPLTLDIYHFKPGILSLKLRFNLDMFKDNSYFIKFSFCDNMMYSIFFWSVTQPVLLNFFAICNIVLRDGTGRPGNLRLIFCSNEITTILFIWIPLASDWACRCELRSQAVPAFAWSTNRRMGKPLPRYFKWFSL